MSARLLRAFVATTALTLPALAYAQTSPSDFTSAVRYDNSNRVTGTIAPDPDGSGPIKYAATRTTYDAAGRATRVETGELSSWQSESVAPSAWSGFTVFSQVDTVYDGLDRKLTVTLSSGGTAYTVTQYSYDAVGRPECTTVRMNASTYGSLPSSACTLATTGSYGPDRVTKNVYDDAGQLLKVQKAYGTPLQQDYVTYTYSNNGKPLTVKDANGNKAGYTYDGLDRLITWAFPDKVTTGTISSTDYEAYTYDANGNRLTLRKRDASVIGYTYDNLNRVTVKDIPGGTSADVYYSYDARGLQTSALFGSTSGAGITNTYDGFSRLATSSNNMSGAASTVSYQYDADGNRTQADLTGAYSFTYTYDGLDRATGLYLGTTVGSSSYLVGWTYNARSSMSQQATRYGATSDYGYDAVDRLNSISLTSTGQDVTLGYQFNPASQLNVQTRSNNVYAFSGYATATKSYVANGLNQYTSAGAATLTYDANGNLTGDGTYAYSYDVENRLVGKSSGLTITYDPNGRLWQTAGGSGGTTRYVYDGDQLVAEYSGSGTLLRQYAHGAGDDDPVYWLEYGTGSPSLFLQRDRSGSIIAVTGAYPTVSPVANSYDEYGNPASGNVGRFQYTGQAWLPDLGMYYYKARIYNPALGRFMQTDPIGYADQNNLYVYVGNDPLNGADPTGLASVCAGTTGSIIGSCVGVDGNGDGNVKDNDLTFSQKTKIASDFRTAIIRLAGQNIGSMGKPVSGTASDDDKAMTRVVSQFIGATVSGKAKGLWGNVTRIQADARQYFGKEAASYRPLLNSSGQDGGKGVIFLGGRVGWIFGGYPYDSPSNLARAFLHEMGHTAIGDESGLFEHRGIDAEARRMLKGYGLDGGGCWSTQSITGMVGFPGC